MIHAPHVIKAKRRSYTLGVDTRKARHLTALVDSALDALFAQTPEDDHCALARICVARMCVRDRSIRGDDDARAWAARQAHAA